MADPVFTLTKVAKKTFGGGIMGIFTFTSDDGDYAAGGFTPTPDWSALGFMNRDPDLVIFQSENGYKYEWDPDNGKIKIRVATTAGTNLPESEHSAAAVILAARTGVRCIAFWFGGGK